MLPAIPLCVEWLDIPVGSDSATENKDSRGNYAVIGTMDPDIEIWNLDLVDCLFPNAILGFGSEPSSSVSRSKKKNKKKKSPKVSDSCPLSFGKPPALQPPRLRICRQDGETLGPFHSQVREGLQLPARRQDLRTILAP